MKSSLLYEGAGEGNEGREVKASSEVLTGVPIVWFTQSSACIFVEFIGDHRLLSICFRAKMCTVKRKTYRRAAMEEKPDAGTGGANEEEGFKRNMEESGGTI